MTANKTLHSAAQSLLRPASERSKIDAFIVMDIMRAAAAKEATGAHVIHMEVGQPATPAPRAALARVHQAMDTEPLGYSLALGLPKLRERIATAYRDWHGLEIAPERVIVTNGSSAAFVLAFLALFDPGAKVALPSPGYPCYRQILNVLGLSAQIIETDTTTRWMPSLEQLHCLHKDVTGLDGVLLASPANPTGTMLEPERLAAIAAFCDEHKIWFISDEIYHGLTYGQPTQTALRYSNNAIIINSFSKYFSMTGWRVGWMIVPDPLVRVLERLAQNLYIAAPSVAQIAALGAFDGMEELEANRIVYARSRDVLLTELPKAGFSNFAPADGGFYLYTDVSNLCANSRDFARRMLAETGVAATPGLDFDARRGHRHMRFSYAGCTVDIIEGAKRLRNWLS